MKAVVKGWLEWLSQVWSGNHLESEKLREKYASLRRKYRAINETYGNLMLRFAAGETKIRVLQARCNRGEGRIRELEQERAELIRLATEDPLTGLANRRGLHERFRTAEGALARSIRVRNGEEHRKHTVVAAILIDVDHFKWVNDTHGHHSGDQVLVGLAELMRQHLGHRPEDILCRYGGEEFLVVLPHATAHDAHIQATLFVDALRAAPLLTGQKVTASAGVAELELNPLNSPADVILQLYHMTDKAMYRAKTLGRDQVVRYSPDLEERRARGTEP